MGTAYDRRGANCSYGAAYAYTVVRVLWGNVDMAAHSLLRHWRPAAKPSFVIGAGECADFRPAACELGARRFARGRSTLDALRQLLASLAGWLSAHGRSHHLHRHLHLHLRLRTLNILPPILTPSGPAPRSSTPCTPPRHLSTSCLSHCDRCTCHLPSRLPHQGWISLPIALSPCRPIINTCVHPVAHRR